MPRTEKVQVTMNCDLCTLSIPVDEKYINAMTYGVVFHIDCLKRMTAHQLVKIMDLDDVKLMFDKDWENAKRLTGIADGQL
jgi:hypothetical protein